MSGIETQPAIGTVYLKVANLERQMTFYQDVIGMRIQHQENDSVFLGANGTDHLLALSAKPEARRYNGTTGLYHFAVLVPSRYHLALSLRRLMDTETPLQGASDHLVSEALYLADPEDNGIEIYRDRPRREWYKNGDIQMGTLPMDFQGVMSELNGQDRTWNGLDAGTIMGHIHLHVASIPAAQKFYHDVLNLDVMFNIGTALFLSYDGYHHHIGANTWSGRTPPPPDALGLDKFILHVSPERLDTIRAALPSDFPVEQSKHGFMIHDPSENVIEVGAYDNVGTD